MLAPLLLAVSMASHQPIVMAHYMPWYESKPVSGVWGWHWTMGSRNPERGEIASHYRPLIGLYDSSDTATLECQIQQMKLAGIDGVFVDWYGNIPHFDYGNIHRNTQKLFEVVRRAGMKFAIVYEDQTVSQLIKGGKFEEPKAVEQGRRLFEWVEKNWFTAPHYLKENGKPVLLVFGPQYYQPDDWRKILPSGVNFYTLHYQKGPAVGGYDWPYPREAGSREAFWRRSKGWPAFIPVAYPRFHDFYAEAKVHESWGHIPDNNGKTYKRTLAESLSSSARFVQIATWNDYGEGTIIEPTVQFGYRDLEATQKLTASKFTANDLRLPARLLSLRRRYRGSSHLQESLASISLSLLQGKVNPARNALSQLER